MRTALMRDTQRLALQCGRTTGIFMRFSTTFAVFAQVWLAYYHNPGTEWVKSNASTRGT